MVFNVVEDNIIIRTTDIASSDDDLAVFSHAFTLYGGE